MIRVKNSLAISLFAVAVLAVPQAGLLAQTPEVDPPVVSTLSNQYVGFALGVSGQWAAVDVDGNDITADVAGRFNIISLKGDPETDADDNVALFGDLTPPITQTFAIRINGVSQQIGTTGTWTKEPRIYSPPAVGTQRGVTGPYLEGIWTTENMEGAASVQATITSTLVRDQVRIELSLKNLGTVSQNVGLGMFLEPTENTRPYLPGIGTSLSQGAGFNFYGTKLSGIKIPEALEFYDDMASPGISERISFRTQDATVPDYLAIGDFEDLGVAGFKLPGGYNPDPAIAITNPAAFAEWAQRALTPGSTRKYIIYMGVGAASSAWTHRSGSRIIKDYAALAVQGPRAVKYDSTTVGGVLTPDSFPIKAYVYNLDTDPGPYKLENVSAYLYLPKGLKLVNNSSPSQRIGEVGINSESAPVEWSVQATGECSGELEYYVSVRDTTGWQQVVSRKIMVPAAKQTVVNGGWQLASVPFTANNLTVEHLFGWNDVNYFAKYWDPAGAGSYKTLSQFTPGQGFWMVVPSLTSDATMDVHLAGDAKINGEDAGKQSEGITINLGQGWNMIGNPYVYPVYLGQLMVDSNTGMGPVSFDDAVAARLLSRTIFWWNPQKGAYDYLKNNDSFLVPWKGYWIRANVPVTLVFRPAVWPGGDVTANIGGL